MIKNLEIVKRKIVNSFIGEDGNLYFNTDGERFSLSNGDEVVSHQYYCMISLGDDHYAVCDLISDARFWADYNEYDVINGEYETTVPKMKWGVIRITRDDLGKIIPEAEIMVIPYIYDRISPNNLKTATAYNEDKLTYLDLNREKGSYGQQLVPCVLNHAVPFSIDYEGFAECSVDDVVGYIPRNCKVKKGIECSELLTESQTRCLSKYLAGSKEVVLDNDTILAYFNLTGELLFQEKVQQLKKTRKNNKGS